MKNMGEMLAVGWTDGIMVNCGETMCKVREQLKDERKEQRRTERR